MGFPPLHEIYGSAPPRVTTALLGAAARFEILEETLLVFVVSDHVLRSGDAHLAAESVAHSVERGALLALGRARASRVLSICRLAFS
jgi:hypothetical protein